MYFIRIAEEVASAVAGEIQSERNLRQSGLRSWFLDSFGRPEEREFPESKPPYQTLTWPGSGRPSELANGFWLLGCCRIIELREREPGLARPSRAISLVTTAPAPMTQPVPALHRPEMFT